MLTNLHVKNLALIEEAEVDFGGGLNIMSGETGAGKSIIIGSVNIALGGKVSKDMIRHGSDFALVELVFQTDTKNIKDYFEEHDLDWEDGQIIISRKITNSKSIIKVNGETVSLTCLKEIASMLMDIHGQHDNESLLKTSRHLDLIDEYGGGKIAELKKEIGEKYRSYQQLRKKMEEFTGDEESRRREISFLEFEIQEIETASLKKNEDEELEEEYRRLSNSGKITSGLGAVLDRMDSSDEGIREQLGRVVKELSELSEMDSDMGQYYSSALDIEMLMGDLSRELSGYLDDMTFDRERYDYIEKRLDFINRLKLKYGKSIEEIHEHCENAQEKLTFYRHFEEEKEKTEKSMKDSGEELASLCDKLTELRKKAAGEISKQIVKALKDLNFLEVKFDAEFLKQEGFTANGNDTVQFLISTNPGEALKPLSKVASGGELSRIMLGFKSILAGKDEVDSLIFDEIDTGISGRTAQMVSEKLRQISRGHQVICITHLPQIASMADNHYLIEKTVIQGTTRTDIRRMTEEESVEELARMLGGVRITDTVLESAREMKKMALS